LLEISVRLVALGDKWPCVFSLAVRASITVSVLIAVFTKVKSFAKTVEAILGIALSVRAARATIVERYLDRSSFSAHGTHFPSIQG